MQFITKLANEKKKLEDKMWKVDNSYLQCSKNSNLLIFSSNFCLPCNYEEYEKFCFPLRLPNKKIQSLPRHLLPQSDDQAKDHFSRKTSLEASKKKIIFGCSSFCRNRYQSQPFFNVAQPSEKSEKIPPGSEVKEACKKNDFIIVPKPYYG